MDDDVTRAAQGALDLLERRGWCQGSSVGPHDECCLRHAIRLQGKTKLLAAVRAKTVVTPSIWNDAPGRTYADVVTLLESLGAKRAA